MTREQQIYKEAESRCIDLLAAKERGDANIICPQSYRAGFMDGAVWADSLPQWIPVEEELPKENGWYLVTTPTLNSKIDVALWDGKWRRLITITHWMPLPQPPRKED